MLHRVPGLAVIPRCGADINWGSVTGGFQAGIDMQRDPEAGMVLNVMLRNAGAEARELRFSVLSFGPTYNIEITAVRENDTVPVFDVRALSEAPASIPEFRDLRLASGATFAFQFPLISMIGVVNHKEIPLDNLLKQSYSLRASLKIDDTAVLTPALTRAEPPRQP